MFGDSVEATLITSEGWLKTKAEGGGGCQGGMKEREAEHDYKSL